MGAPSPRLTPRDAASAVRLAVRSELGDLPPDSVAAVAVSGGRDSLALMGAAVAVAPDLGLQVVVLTVDHGWHPGSADVAGAVAAAAAAAGCRAQRLSVPPGAAGGGSGPEGDARRARYDALDAAAGDLGADAILLGHTLDDQAETVLLALARGSGARSLSGMPARRGRYRRPLLGLRRATVAAALPVLTPTGLPPGLPWEDPANTDPRYARARVRASALPAVEAALGPGAVPALARSAELLRADADALDALAARSADAVLTVDPASVRVALPGLRGLEPAVRARVLRIAAARGGAGPLTAVHTRALARLAEAAAGSGAGPVALPGGATASRTGGELVVRPGPGAGT